MACTLNGMFLALAGEPKLAQNTPAPSPRAGGSVIARIANKETHEYSLRLDENEFVSIVVDQQGTDVTVSLLDPSGKPAAAVDSLNYAFGHEPLACIAGTAGEYRLVVTSSSAGTGRYEFKVLARRKADGDDRAFVDALNAYSRAVTLLLNGAGARALAEITPAVGFAERSPGVDASVLAIFLEVQARALAVTGDVDRSLTVLTRAIALREQSGPESYHMLYALETYAAVRRETGRPDEAASCLARIVSILDRTYGTNEYATRYYLVLLGDANKRASKFVEAEAACRRVLALDTACVGPDSLESAAARDDLAKVLLERNQFAEAETLLSRSFEIRKKKLNEDHPLVAVSLQNLGVHYKEVGRPLEAETYLVRALDIRERKLGPESPFVAQTLNTLGGCFHQRGLFSKAEAQYLRALAIREKTDGPNQIEVATACNSLAAVYLDTGQFRQSKALFERALAIREKTFGPDHPQTAAILTGLGAVLYSEGRYDKALPMLERGMNIHERAGTASSWQAASNLQNLATTLTEMGQYERASRYLQQALALCERIKGADHPDTGLFLLNLGNLQVRLKEHEAAARSFDRSISIFESQGGDDSVFLALAIHNRAEVYRRTGDLGTAERFALRALAISEKTLGSANRLTGAALLNLAILRKERGDYAAATDAIGKAEASFEGAFGRVHPYVALALVQDTCIRALSGDTEAAVRTLDEAVGLRERMLGAVLATGSEKARREYLDLCSFEYDAALFIHASLAPGSERALSLALETLLRRKGRALDTMTDAIRDLRRNATADDRKLLDELAEARGQIAALSAARTGDETSSRTVRELVRRAEEIESEVSRRSLKFQAATMPVTVDAVRRRIPGDGALVEFALYRTLDLRKPTDARDGPARYAAYIVRRDEAPAWVDLGDAAAIDASVGRFRSALADRGRTDVGNLAREVDRLVMQPMRPHLKGRKSLLLAPDGVLNLVPFAALVDERGRYLLETWTISYLTSGRDLLRPQEDTASRTAPVIFSDPDYGASMPETSVARRDIAQSGTTGFSRLPGTAEESRKLLTLMPEAVAYTQKDASEEALKQIRNPAILHIATHGFFREAVSPVDRDNSMLRSGLALAGANGGSRPDGAEDGIVTALEMAAMDLSGTQLVVLSACNTGVGDIRVGDGVSGLRRSLVLAGSESQIISLWSISDDATSNLMESFYTGLLKGQGRAEALRQVQLHMARSRGTKHPFYWAGFIQSGAWGPIHRGGGPAK